MKLMDKLDLPAKPELTQSDLMILIGLVTKEWADIGRDPNREAYYKTLTHLREALFKADKT